MRCSRASQVRALKDEGAQAIVCLSHLGGGEHGSGADAAVASQVTGIDAIIGGHDHHVFQERVMNKEGRSVLVVHAGAFYEWVGQLTLTLWNGTVAATERLVRVDAGVPRDLALSQAVEVLQGRLDAIYGEKLFHAPIAFALADVAQYPPDGWPQRDSPVGDLIADALRHAGGTDFGLTANGLLTEGLWRGPLVREDAFRIVGDGLSEVGLGFQLSVIQLPGQLLYELMQVALGQGGDLFPIVSGFRCVYDGADPTRPVALLRNGRPLPVDAVYSVTVNRGLIEGLQALAGELENDYPELAGALESVVKAREDRDQFEYPAVRDWMSQLKVLLYVPQGRVLDVSKL